MDIRSASPVLTATTIAATRGAIQRVLRSSIPALADFCFAFLVAGPSIICVSGAHGTPDGTRMVRALRRVYRVDRGDPSSTVAHVIRTSQPVLRAEIPSEPTLESRNDIVAQLHHRLAARSAIAVPIYGRGTVIGALTLCYSHSARKYVSDDIPSASHVAARIARLLTRAPLDATLGLRSAARHARQGTTVRRRVASRN